MREKIGILIKAAQSEAKQPGGEVGVSKDYYADKILALITPKDIEWVGECICKQGVITWCTEEGCACCQNTGIQTRPATIEEALGTLPRMVEVINAYGSATDKEILTINGGTLQVKEA